ncbi:TonB-dependent siderophore receptor [Pseudozobellia thermophila]|uniref:Iron complex outermembrane recepter protein n=1 Tax=Pseudozobellia thermophila TaxID=192903 RepID=A0A1M6HE14_9FLAO|nr:TonB-dependent siderophore receptor [Pseudozobellia thermophila]SHJ20435.1 iron complex outermembrane recepter protein [Pseudozobellia thermophila]
MKQIILPVLLLICSMALAQNTSVQGKVTDTDNNPLPYVTVRIANTDTGTTTDENGAYSFRNISKNTVTLVFSSIGMKTAKKTITLSETGITRVPPVVMTEQQELLDEVIVEGHKDKYLEREPSQSLRLQTELVKLPQNIQVISDDLLKDQQVTSIMDGLTRNVSGVTMLEHWGHFARINMRGFRLPAFRNGINVQDSWGPLSEDMNTVERVEFVKGPAGFMMAAGEPGGFYNVVTKKPTEEFIARASISAGSFDFYRGTVDLGGKLSENGKLLGRFNAMYQTSDSHRGNEDVTRYGIAPSLTYRFSDKTSITTEMNLQQAESYIGSAYVFAPADAGYASLDRDFKFTNDDYPVTDIQEVTFFTNLDHEFSENWSLHGQLAYLRYDQVGNSTWLSSMAENGDAVRYTSKWDALSIGKYAQLYVNGQFNTFGLSHKVMGGFDYSDKSYWADWNELSIVDTATPFNIYNPVYGESPATNFDRSLPIQERNGGTPYGASILRSYYAQDEIGLFDERIRLTLAGRYSNLYTQGKAETDDVVTPRIGISADIIPSLTFYALYDQSFLPQSGISASGEALNDPVNGKDLEGGLKGSFFDGRLRTSLGVYKINKDKILVGDPAYPNDNFSIYSGEIESKGIEFDLQGEIATGLNLILNYANTNVKDKSGTLQAGHSKHVTNGWLNYGFDPLGKLKGFGISLGYQYQVDRSTWAWAADNQSDLPDYFRLDGALSWQNPHFRVQFNINNILDEYLYAGANYGSYLYWQSEPGINGRLTIAYTF